MKTKEKKELFSKTVKELRVILKEAREAVIDLNMDKSQHKLKNERQIFNKKKDIARMLTAIKEREFADAKNA